MKKIVAIALLIASAAAFPVATPAFAVAGGAANDPLCQPDSPEGYKRPGGYCEQIDSNGSLVEDKGCDYREVVLMLASLKPGERLLVADNCDYPLVK